MWMEERSRIGTSGSTTGGPGGRPASVSEELAGGGSRRSSGADRAAAFGALGLALLVVALLVPGGGSGYTLNADFPNARGLVTGDSVLSGPAPVGSINPISLTRRGPPPVKMSRRG